MQRTRRAVLALIWFRPAFIINIFFCLIFPYYFECKTHHCIRLLDFRVIFFRTIFLRSCSRKCSGSKRFICLFFLYRTVSRRKREHFEIKKVKEGKNYTKTSNKVRWLALYNRLVFYMRVYSSALDSLTNSDNNEELLKTKECINNFIVLFLWSLSDWGGFQLFSAVFVWRIISIMSTFYLIHQCQRNTLSTTVSKSNYLQVIRLESHC